ncbi:hypothetical protein BU17DRAFT_49500 [Hysterangium stoloniferum]|nr:hypothetical protein BU17DRAFT_49500 [Hysterangium stoloniferum]
MSSAFAELMKLSQSQTAQSEQAVESQIAAHRSQLEKKRKEQEAKERREREVAAKLRLKRLEEQRLEEARKKKKAEEEAARQKALEKREAHALDALKYGPKKAASLSASRARAGDRADVGFSDDESGPVPLTREEKRERKLAAQLRRAGGSTHGSRRGGGSRHTTALSDGRVVRRLPGGAVDVTITSRLADPEAAASAVPSDLANKGVRERLTAMPVGLMKLNTVKRDVRTIEEILSDRAKVKAAKVLDGDDAKEFSDWFGKSKKKEKLAAAAAQPSLSQSQSRASPQRHSSDGPSRAVSATPSTSTSPTPTTSHVNPFAGSAISTTPKSKPSPMSGGGDGVSSSNGASSFFKSINPKANAARPAGSATRPPAAKKRARSPSPGPPASGKRRNAGAGLDRGKLSKTIWSMFGGVRKFEDVYSDEEDIDMEADARVVLKEEARSARLAYREDEAALAEERRREEEKRRRKKERERRERERA